MTEKSGLFCSLLIIFLLSKKRSYFSKSLYFGRYKKLGQATLVLIYLTQSRLSPIISNLQIISIIKLQNSYILPINWKRNRNIGKIILTSLEF